jgi:diguanylate cyclase (GGDEF)-like protein
MIQGNPDILVLGPAAIDEPLSRQLPGMCLRRQDPYELLEDLARRPWRAVVIACDARDLPELCRAARRLMKRGQLLAIAAPADEPQLAPMVGGLIDDYVLWPPERGELAVLRKAAGASAPSTEPRAAGAASPQVTPDDMAELLRRGTSIDAVEQALADMVLRRTGTQCQWRSGPGGGHVLLRLGPDRVLEAQSPAPSAQAFTEQLAPLAAELAATARRTESLEWLSVTDHLTESFNRRYFYSVTQRVLKQVAQRPEARAAVLLYDIDNFKHYNDTYGYAAGDEILRDAARLMRQIVRSQDVVARIGGDEFAILLWEPHGPRAAGSEPPTDSAVLAERIRRAVETHRFASLGPEATGSLTVSGGLASYPHDGRTLQELLRSADKALKACKRGGKNAIRLIGQ